MAENNPDIFGYTVRKAKLLADQFIKCKMDLGLAADKCKIKGGLTTVNIWISEHPEFKNLLHEAKDRLLYELTASMVEAAIEKPGVGTLRVLDSFVTGLLDVNPADIPTNRDTADSSLEEFVGIFNKMLGTDDNETEPGPPDLSKIRVR